VSCPLTYTVQGITYHNDNNESLPAGTPLTTDFAQSCNNAFTQQWPHLSGGGLAATARKYFGLNQSWSIGIQGQEQPNSWLIAFDPTQDIAVACLVVSAGYGAQFAGPEVASFLSKY
jgi:hypothetical protein